MSCLWCTLLCRTCLCLTSVCTCTEFSCVSPLSFSLCSALLVALGEVVHMIKKSKISSVLADRCHRTPLHLAAYGGRVCLCVCVCVCMNLPFQSTPSNVLPPFSFSLSSTWPCSGYDVQVAVGQVLLNKLKAKPNLQDDDGWTPLHYACRVRIFLLSCIYIYIYIYTYIHIYICVCVCVCVCLWCLYLCVCVCVCVYVYVCISSLSLTICFASPSVGFASLLCKTVGFAQENTRRYHEQRSGFGMYSKKMFFKPSSSSSVFFPTLLELLLCGVYGCIFLPFAHLV
jgi:hypothetical protein